MGGQSDKELLIYKGLFQFCEYTVLEKSERR